VAEVIIMTREELEAEKAGILREFPEIEGFFGDEYEECCPGCRSAEIAEYTSNPSAVMAAERLSDILFLLGGDE
jgi:hypothetical protein